ncbi:hypothetical protein APHCRT_1129 [Anaplasma phagocytophilum str. CRT53-1]|uniref:Uncharacterized protein n=1 Tax=Anaplasma phagocytophilum str. CRT53-1 TaxID=1359157 RepID=A0A0F3PXM3_ANAPH|nr:hypothetical protein APHCRT_1129 [Anaplasma phagocytophilum str. CRT53-1]
MVIFLLHCEVFRLADFDNLVALSLQRDCILVLQIIAMCKYSNTKPSS